MKVSHFTAAFRLLLVSLLLFACAKSPAPKSGAQTVDEQWLQAIAANNLDAVMACYSKDAVLWLPNAPEAKGYDAIRKAYAGLLDANNVRQVAVTNTHYESAQDFSAGWGEYSLTLVPKSGGDPVTMTGRFTEVAKREDGKWVYVVDHASSPAAPPQQTKQ